MTALKPYQVEVPIRAGRDAVWAAVTQPELLRQWFDDWAKRWAPVADDASVTVAD